MATKSKRHTHKYYRASTSFGKVWACALPDCNHYMPQHMDSMVTGKNSLCWTCGEQFQLNAINMRDKQPMCDECSNRAIDIDELSEAMKARLAQSTE